MADLIAAVRRAASTWSRRRAERRLWANVATVDELAELLARFVEGELTEWPYHAGPREPETVEIAPALATANRNGFLTIGSQPGRSEETGNGWEQRAAVDGLATPEVVGQLRDLVTGTRLQMQARMPASWKTDYSTAVPVTRLGNHEHTVFGAVVPPREIGFMFDGVPDDVVDQLIDMHQVAIVDPEWGDHDLLWQRLAQLEVRCG